MNTGGDAAEQVVRLSLEGMEVTAKIAGAGAKQVAAMLYALMKDQNKTHGKTRMTNMLRSGQELKVFTVPNKNLKKFQQQAKRYGVLYCALRKDRTDPDGMTDIMVRATDASKINRIVERFKMESTVDTASIKTEITKSRAEQAQTPPEQERPTKSKEEVLLDELLAPVSKPEKQVNPSPAQTEPVSAPSANFSEKSAPAAKSSEGVAAGKPSVRAELARIREEQRAGSTPEKEPSRNTGKRLESPPSKQKTTRHYQPKHLKKPKMKGER